MSKGNPISPSYYEKLAKIESNNNPLAEASTSTAAGLYQFTEATWNDMVKSMNLDYTLDDRFDPKKARIVAEAFTERNAYKLKANLGRNPTENELYLAHFLGSGGADKLLNTYKKKPDAKVSDILSQSVIKANKNVFLNEDGSDKTVSDIYNWSSQKVGKGTVKLNLKLPRPKDPFAVRPNTFLMDDKIGKINQALKDSEKNIYSQSEQDLFPQYNESKLKKKKNPEVLNKLSMRPTKNVSFGGLPKLDF